jgi:hypothetical protein
VSVQSKSTLSRSVSLSVSRKAFAAATIAGVASWAIVDVAVPSSEGVVASAEASLVGAIEAAGDALASAVDVVGEVEGCVVEGWAAPQPASSAVAAKNPINIRFRCM